jgi:hypothetical protein
MLAPAAVKGPIIITARLLDAAFHEQWPSRPKHQSLLLLVPLLKIGGDPEGGPQQYA